MEVEYETAFEGNALFDDSGNQDEEGSNSGEFSSNKKQRFNDFKMKPRYWVKNYQSPVCILHNDNGIALSSTGFLIVGRTANSENGAYFLNDRSCVIPNYCVFTILHVFLDALYSLRETGTLKEKETFICNVDGDRRLYAATSNFNSTSSVHLRKKWCPQKAAGKKQEMGSESWVFTRSGCIFSPDAMKKFIRGSTALLISSLGHSETRQIFEYLYTVFETIVEEEGVEKATQYLLWLSDDSPVQRDEAIRKLVVVKEDILDLSYNGIRKVLIGNWQVFAGVCLPLLHANILKEKNEDINKMLKVDLYSKYKKEEAAAAEKSAS